MRTWRPFPLSSVRLRDRYLAPRVEANHAVTIPSSLQKCRDTGRIDAFRLDWKTGQEKPHVFWDSDVAKVVEGLALDLILHPDDTRAREELDALVDLIVSAQQPDGYLNIVYTTVDQGKRWTSLTHQHELYCAGHLMEAAVAHHAATGSRKFLDAMARFADHIATVFGTGPGQVRGYGGHPEIELALVKLAVATGDRRHLELAKYFVDERGREPNFFQEEARRDGHTPHRSLTYWQAHQPVREQQDAVGHAVRALYLYTGMADVAAGTNDIELLDAVDRLWRSVAQRNMYVTGGVGQTPIGEAFTRDYHLPNDTAYAESCAAMALVQLSRRLLDIHADGRYADVMERALFNAVMAGISLHGAEFFYANLLEVDAHSFVHGDTHATRQPWFWCSCCPTSYCRFLPQVGSFAVSAGDDHVAVHFPVAMDAAFTVASGRLEFVIDGGYPYDGASVLTVKASEGEVGLKLRIPGWCREHRVGINGEVFADPPHKGYVTLAPRAWREGDRIELDLAMPVRRVRANREVAADAGKVSLARGPLVYALESVDQPAPLSALRLPPDAPLESATVPGLPEGTVALRGPAWVEEGEARDALYVDDVRPTTRATELTAIPVALWQNRGEAAMTVWIRE